MIALRIAFLVALAGGTARTSQIGEAKGDVNTTGPQGNPLLWLSQLESLLQNRPVALPSPAFTASGAQATNKLFLVPGNQPPYGYSHYPKHHIFLVLTGNNVISLGQASGTTSTKGKITQVFFALGNSLLGLGRGKSRPASLNTTGVTETSTVAATSTPEPATTPNSTDIPSNGTTSESATTNNSTDTPSNETTTATAPNSTDIASNWTTTNVTEADSAAEEMHANQSRNESKLEHKDVLIFIRERQRERINGSSSFGVETSRQIDAGNSSLIAVDSNSTEFELLNSTTADANVEPVASSNSTLGELSNGNSTIEGDKPTVVPGQEGLFDNVQIFLKDDKTGELRPLQPKDA